jgi:hypothetical protein
MSTSGRRRHAVERGGHPVDVVGVAGVERSARLDEVAREQHPLRRQPRHDVAVGVPASAPRQLELAARPAEVDAQPVGEGDRGPGEAGDRLGPLEQSRHPAGLAGPVLEPALVDERPGPLVGDDGLGAESGGAQGAYGVVVRQHEIADGLVGVLAQPVEPPLGHDRCGPRLEGDDEVLGLDRPDVGVTLGRQRVDAVADDLERLLLARGVGRRRERLGHPGLLRVTSRQGHEAAGE